MDIFGYFPSAPCLHFPTLKKVKPTYYEATTVTATSFQIQIILVLLTVNWQPSVVVILVMVES